MCMLFSRLRSNQNYKNGALSNQLKCVRRRENALGVTMKLLHCNNISTRYSLTVFLLKAYTP